MIDYENGFKKLTAKEFKSLERVNGRVVRLSDIFFRLTDKQIEALNEDDYSYYNELDEELNLLMEEAHAEFS